MKFFIVVLACIAAAAAQNRASAFASYKNNYQPYQGYQGFQGFQPNQYNPYNQYKQQQYRYQPQFTTARPVVSVTPVFEPVTAAPTPFPVQYAKYNGDARSANIVRLQNDINPDGSYSYLYETDNGIAAQEQGSPRAVDSTSTPIVAQGSYSYTSPEGVPVSITYIADENGFRAEGSVIPVGPEVPPQIARALAYTAKYVAQKK